MKVGILPVFRGTIDLPAMNPQRQTAAKGYLNVPFEQYVESVDLNGAVGKGYPGVTITVAKDGTAMTVRASIDTKTSKYSKEEDGNILILDPTDGFLTEVDRIFVAPDGTETLLFEAGVECSDPASNVCKAFEGTVKDWASQRLTVNEAGTKALVKEFMGEEYAGYKIVSARDYEEAQRKTGEEALAKTLADLKTANTKIKELEAQEPKQVLPSYALPVGGGIGVLAVVAVIYGVKKMFRYNRLYNTLLDVTQKLKTASTPSHLGQINPTEVISLAGRLEQTIREHQ